MAKIPMRTEHLSVVSRGGKCWVVRTDKVEYGPYSGAEEASEDMLGLQRHYDDHPSYSPSSTSNAPFVLDALFLSDDLLEQHPVFDGILESLFINVKP